MIKSPVILAVTLLVSVLVAIGYQTVAMNKVRQKKIYTPGQVTEVKADKPADKVPTFPELAKQNLMGVAARQGDGGKQAGEQAKAESLKFILMGTIITTGGSKKSSAFIQAGSHETRRYYVGETLDAGVTLESVAADAAVIKRNGKSETLNYPKNDGPAAPAPIQPRPAVVPVLPGNDQRPAAVPGGHPPGPRATPTGLQQDLRNRTKNPLPGPNNPKPRPPGSPPGNH